MSYFIKIVAMVCLLAITNSGVAGPRAQLIVGFKFIPTACLINLSNGGIIDFGVMDSAGWQHNTSGYYVATQSSSSVAVSVSCSDPRQVVLHFNDNRMGSDKYFSFGKTTTGKNIGRYKLFFSNVMGNGKLHRRDWIMSGSTGVMDFVPSPEYLGHGSFDIRVNEAEVLKETFEQNDGEINLDGSVMIELHYP